jgi:hypothetical protein
MFPNMQAEDDALFPLFFVRTAKGAIGLALAR